jgi:hypothetical protein
MTKMGSVIVSGGQREQTKTTKWKSVPAKGIVSTKVMKRTFEENYLTKQAHF